MNENKNLKKHNDTKFSLKEQNKEWLKLSMTEKEYHFKQWDKPYRSTEKFVEWLEKLGYLNKEDKLTICDIACGAGSNLNYLHNKFPKCSFTGIELNEELVLEGNRKLQNIECCHIEQGDWYNLDIKYINKFNGVLSFQTLSWLPEYKEALKSLVNLNPDWIAVTSLFYEGNIDYITKVIDYNYDETIGHKEFYYNVYSLIQLKKFLNELGYSKFEYLPFDIDIDIPKPEAEVRGTYTIKTEEGKRIQVSGAQLMPWYFVLAAQ